MKTAPKGNFYKIVLFLLLVFLFSAIIVIAVDGWQKTEPTEQTPVADLSEDSTAIEKTTFYIPTYTSYLTGEETTSTLSVKKPVALVLSPETTTYGTSQVSLLAEIPTEFGKTRWVAFFNEVSSFGQIGPILPTRAYVSNLITSFGGLLFASGNDDAIAYAGNNVQNSVFDLESNTSYIYTKNGTSIFSNGYMLTKCISDSFIFSEISGAPVLPYTFVEYGKQIASSTTISHTVFLPFSDTNTTLFSYNAQTENYTIYKNQVSCSDGLNNASISFKNIFILLTDALTYEKSDVTQTVMDTLGQGNGYYLSGGYVYRFRWTADENGMLHFYDAAGSTLIVNRGQTYLAFYKSSLKDQIQFQ